MNPNTIQKAYRELEYQGFIYTVAGLGTFVSKAVDKEVDVRRVGEVTEELRRGIRELGFLGLTQEQISMLLKDLLEERGDLR